MTDEEIQFYRDHEYCDGPRACQSCREAYKETHPARRPQFIQETTKEDILLSIEGQNVQAATEAARGYDSQNN